MRGYKQPAMRGHKHSVPYPISTRLHYPTIHATKVRQHDSNYIRVESEMTEIEPTAMATTATPRIAIIGGGPGGLTLALTLHQRGIPSTVYERETSPDSRANLGGMLDLGYESGQRALRENGLEEVFARHSQIGRAHV